jgi:hypothetical protein
MDRRAQAWAASGAMALTGRAEGPALGAPAALVDLADQAARLTSGGLDAPLDGLALLGERAALQGLARQGTHSAGGSTRLLAAADGWLALSLARPDDVASLSAWLEGDISTDDPWPLVTEAVARSTVARCAGGLAGTSGRWPGDGGPGGHGLLRPAGGWAVGGVGPAARPDRCPGG